VPGTRPGGQPRSQRDDDDLIRALATSAGSFRPLAPTKFTVTAMSCSREHSARRARPLPSKEGTGRRDGGPSPAASCISDWVLGGGRVFDGDHARMVASRAPVTKLVFLPRADATVLDTWYSGGLRGRGSHDFELKDVFVPARRSAWCSEPRTESGPLYKLPTIGSFSTMVASVSLGRRPSSCGRAFLFETLAEPWPVVCSGTFLSWEQRGLLWLSSGSRPPRQLRRRCRLSIWSTARAARAPSMRRRDSRVAYATFTPHRST
jgi:hypothetical protein